MKKISRLLGIIIVFLLAFSIASCNNATEAKKDEQKEIIKTGKRVYFAGPMFNFAEKEFNLQVTHILEDYGYQVFLPQRDGIEGALLEGKTEEELVDIIFPLDVEEVLKADILFMNVDGRVTDEGACVELGMAYNAGKRCYAIKTDTHSVETGMELNPMITGCMIKIFKNIDGNKLFEDIKEYLNDNEL